MEMVRLFIILVLLLLFILNIDFIDYIIVRVKRHFRKKPNSPCEYCREGYEKADKIHMDDKLRVFVCREDIIETVRGLKRG